MARTHRMSHYRRCLAGALAALIGLGPLLTPAYALTALGDQPIGAQVKAKPNIMLTVDDSSSMLYDFLPDSVIGTQTGPGNYCRDITGRMNAQCGLFDIAIDLTALGRGKDLSPGYAYEQFGFPYPAYQNTVRVQGNTGLSAPEAIDNSGPGAGCTSFASLGGAYCSGGIDPGALPGIERFPNPTTIPKSPKAGKAYEYWSLWPAPAHNSEVNHLYYNPRITYKPPINPSGSPLPQMTAGYTSNWTHVVADPWAETLKYVDLTAQVTIGMWCNSDWSLGHENNSAYCRTNGTGSGAASSSTATTNGDYSFPWVPPGINPDDGVQPTTAKSIAFSKVVFNPATHAYDLLPAWTTAQNPKYFYENDNILWCDPKNAAFPADGVVINGTCNIAPPTPNTCTGFITQTCGGGTQSTCVGVAHQNCDGTTPQTCNFQPNVCGSAVPQTCVDPPAETCSGPFHQSCGPTSAQTCNGFQDGTCGGFVDQACVGGGGQSCIIPAVTCDPPALGAGHYEPAGCELICNPGDPECSCAFVPDPNTCSTNHAQTCTSSATCPAPGHCDTFFEYCDAMTACPVHSSHCVHDGGPCTTSAECRQEGTCLGSSCHAGDAACHNDGTCTGGDPLHPRSCTGHMSGECPDTGYCTPFDTTTPCTPATEATDCVDHNGFCSAPDTLKPCFDPMQCTRLPYCSGTGFSPCANPGGSDPANCPDLGGVCTADLRTCTATPTDTCIPAGHCTGPTGNICHSNGDCLPTGGFCHTNNALQCDGVTIGCPDTPGTCDSGATTPPGGCFNTGQCPVVGATCSADIGTPCSVATQASDCPTHLGYCSADPLQTRVCSYSGDPICQPIIGSGFCAPPNATTPCTLNSQCQGSAFDPAAAVCSDLLNGSTSLTIPVPNGNFEAVIPLAGGNYNYIFNVGGPWQTYGYVGIQHYPSSALGGGGLPNPPLSGDGLQTAFIQGVLAGTSMWQYLTMPAGSYRVTFLLAQRNCCVPGPQPISVSIDDVPIADPITPPGTDFTAYTLQFTILSGGSHKLAFTGTALPGDRTTFIDAVSITSGMSLLEDANGPGNVCRHNNQDYGAGAHRYDYPNAQFNTPVTGGTGANACTPSPRYASVARHYWKTGVEWCTAAVSSPGDAWLGYGLFGTCQDSADSMHPTPRFYKFGADSSATPVDAAYSDNYATPAFQRMDLNALLNPMFTHTFFDDSHTLQTITRNFNDEMINYANWFAYYRTRITAVKTVTSLVFQSVDSQYRVGLETLYVDPHTTFVQQFLNIADFTAPQPSNFITSLFDIIVPLGQQTPSLDAMVRIGEYYRTGSAAALPGSGGAPDPITLTCQKNWHIYFTDGYTNQPALPPPPPTIADEDLNVPATYPNFATDPIVGLVPNAAWPHPYQENPALPTPNSLSDYAMHYWVTDLRPGMIDNVPTCPSPRSVTCTDPANWQHVNFAAISLGTSGKLSASSPADTEALLASGALQWPQPTPSVFRPDSSGVDDLWHAAVNSRGGFVNAETPDDVQLGLGQLLQAALNSTGTRSGVGFLSNTFGPSAKFLYRAQFTAGWGGSLAKIAFDPTTGAPGAQQWDAADQLTAQLVPDGLNPSPWFTKRKIVTMTEGGVKVPFLWGSISALQRDSLAPGKPSRGQAVLEFLRGNRAKEGVKLGQFRKRPSNTVLGDIVDSSPLYVGAPNWPYTDDNDPGYSAFSTGAAATRPARVYAGANDGMLHAFDDTTGNETWAYIPSTLFHGDVTGLGALSYQDGALPPFRHHFYVDSTPRVVDVDFNAPSGDWHTILVGGMGKGGNRYYALDVTLPVDSGVTEVASTTKVLWEFPPPGDTTTDMGYTYGRPFIAKTHAFGGEWMVIVASGYNTPSGGGKLYFLRARDGHLEMTLSAGGACSSGEPAGLAHAAGYTKDFRNQLVEQIYAGDLCGNLWRFDVSDPDPANWQPQVGVMARLVDGFGDPQPVTTPPEIKIDPDNGVDRWVFVGTGRLLDDSDLTAPNPAQQQTLYAFRDGTDTTPLPLVVPPLSRSPPNSLDLLPSTSTANHFGLAAKPDKGWYDDLPTDPNQRIIVPPQAAAGIIGYVGTSPPLNDPCLTALPATVYARAYSTGQSALLDSDSVTILPSIFSPSGGVGVAIVAFETATGTTGLDVRVAITGFDGSVKYYKTKPGANANKYRMSWRLLGQ